MKLYNSVLALVMRSYYPKKINDHTKLDVDGKVNEFLHNTYRFWMTSGYKLHDVEDAFHDVLMNYLLKAREGTLPLDFSVNTIKLTMKNYLWRRRNKENGKTATGKDHKNPWRAKIVNLYDKEGNNIIENVGYDENGEVVIGSGDDYD